MTAYPATMSIPPVLLPVIFAILKGIGIQILQYILALIGTQIGFGHMIDFRENVSELVSKAEDLNRKYSDIEGEREEASRNGQRLTNQAENWLVEARNIKLKIDIFKLEYDEQGRIFFKAYKLGKRAFKLLEGVKELINGGGDYNRRIANNSPRRVLEMPTTSTHGRYTFDPTLDEIWGHLHDERDSIICVYGVGRIGKSTLMKAINNRLLGTQVFDIVIWIDVCEEDFNLERIQKDIGKRLYLKFNDDDDCYTRRTQILSWLKNKRYVLILDNLWQKISLDEIGIPKPNPQNKFKIAITTRLVDVCNDMVADVKIMCNAVADVKIRVQTLTADESWDLFFENAGEVVLLSDIRPIAEEVVMKCGGMPQAIITLGLAMRGKEKMELWRNALNTSILDIRGMKSQVFDNLKGTYDRLEEGIKIYFLYCSLFPEGYAIDIKKLVESWVKKGWLDGVDGSITNAVNKGHAIIERLKDACLLEDMPNGKVKMHGLLRQLGIGIISSSSDKGPKFMFLRSEPTIFDLIC